MPAERVGQIHLAGHSEDGGLLIDTHDGYVADGVWRLYADAVGRFGARSTMIEWDAEVPAFEELEAELGRAARWEKMVLGERRHAA